MLFVFLLIPYEAEIRMQDLAVKCSFVLFLVKFIYAPTEQDNAAYLLIMNL